MYEYETIVTFDRILSFAGIPIFAKSNWNSKKWLLFQIFNFFLGFITFVFTTGFVISNLSNLLLCIQGACVWTTGVIMFISLGVCLIFRQQFRSFLEEVVFKDCLLEMPFIYHVLQLNFRNGKLGELKKSVINSRETLFRLTRVLLKTYIASVGMCATLYLCGPIYLMCIRNDKSLRLLAFDMWFPWGLENFAIYVASFVFHAYVGYLCCIAMFLIYALFTYTAGYAKGIWGPRMKTYYLSILFSLPTLIFFYVYAGLQSMIILLVGQIIRQLKILTFILSNMDELIVELIEERGDKWQRECTSLLSQCVDHFVKIKRFSNRLNVICQPFYLAVILVAIMLVCVCSVKIAISDKLSPDILKYYVHEVCIILVVLMLCSLGQQVENECEKLEMAVTEKWYIFNSKHRVNVRIFKMALSQRMPIYIFGSITLSLPTFTWFIRTGMSFFTLVMSVLEE